MNSILMRSALRQKRLNNIAMMATRGHFHKPDPLPYPTYKHTRRIHMEEINTQLYSDMAPEFYMHLHSIQVKSAKRGWFLIASYFALIIAPFMLIARKIQSDAGSMMCPSVRPGQDHAHMAPRLITHLQANDFVAMADRFGRRDGTFYRQWVIYNMSSEFKPDVVQALNTHGFKY